MAKKNRGQDSKILLILIGILVVCLFMIAFLFYKYFYAGTSGTKYGDRLDGIENYVLKDTLVDDIKALYTSEDSVGEITVNNEGKIIYINMDFTKSIKVATAQSLAVKSLEAIGEENLTYYEIQYILTYSGEEENENFPIFGSKNANSLKVVW